ncbi:hypothetical protein [Ottowia thiooxydans]|uniref:Uncharacterized protein n=1 Tax=Ottowia thiooxydans TaxID=219182 RepID=A0ABV2QGJ2_9BURK
MKRRYVLRSFGLIALPGLLAACGPGDGSSSPTPPPAPPSPADKWTPGVFLNASSFGSGTPALTLQPNGAGKVLAVLGPAAEALAFTASSLDSSTLSMQRPGGTPSVLATAADMRAGALWLWRQSSDTSVAQSLFYAVSSASNGQIGASRTLPLSAAVSLQAWIMAQDADGNALVRWSSGPLDSTGQPSQAGLLRFTASTQVWSALSSPNSLISPNLLGAARAVFDSSGRAWLIQPTPGTVAGEWSLALFTLNAGASNWVAIAPVPATTARSSTFQMSMDASNRLLVAHTVSGDASSAPLSLSRFDPNGSGWTAIAAPTLASNAYRVNTDPVGNIWAVGSGSIARYDNAAANWTGPKSLDFAPTDAQQGDGTWPLALTSDSKGNTWAVGVRRKAAGQDLPVLWINLFDATTRQWAQAGSLAVADGTNSSFVQPTQGEGTRFLVALTLDSQGRPVAALKEMLTSASQSYQSRSWIARGQAA